VSFKNRLEKKKEKEKEAPVVGEQYRCVWERENGWARDWMILYLFFLFLKRDFPSFFFARWTLLVIF
jgi:hypothetical protein